MDGGKRGARRHRGNHGNGQPEMHRQPIISSSYLHHIFIISMNQSTLPDDSD